MIIYFFLAQRHDMSAYGKREYRTNPAAAGSSSMGKAMGIAATKSTKFFYTNHC